MKLLYPNPRNPRWLLLIWLLMFGAGQHAWAQSAWLQLGIPGQPLNLINQEAKTGTAGWYALSLEDGALVVESAGAPIPSEMLHVSGKRADQLLAGGALRRPAKALGVSLKTGPGTLLLMRIQQNDGGYRKLTSGRFPGAVAPTILREGWMDSGKVGANLWKFSVAQQKRPDGKLLAGSLEIIAAPDFLEYANRVLLPPASGMAFSKQELLWLGDFDQDGDPDLLVKRTWITGEIDFVLGVSSMLASAYVDPDHPAEYFSSGVEPESNEFSWYQEQPVPVPLEFINKGSFSVGGEEWHRLIPDEAPDLPKVLADRLFKLEGETIRFTLEYLPRAVSEGASSAGGGLWDGSVLVRVSFRGKSQVLMQAHAPDEGVFALSVGLINGKPSVRVGYQPHYNNSITRYWMLDAGEGRFRRLRSEHFQGC